MKWFRRKKAYGILREYHFDCYNCPHQWSHRSIHEPTGVEICPHCSYMRCGKDIWHTIDRADIISAINDCDQYACRECRPEYFSKTKEDKEMKCPCGKDMPKNHADICSYECYKKYYHKCKTLDCCETISVKLTYCVSCAGGKKECGRCHKHIGSPGTSGEYCVDCATHLAAYNACPDCGIDKSRGIRKCWDCFDKSKEEPKMKECERDDNGEVIWSKGLPQMDGYSYYHLCCVKCKKWGLAFYWPPEFFNMCERCFKEHNVETLVNMGKIEVKEFDLRPFEVNRPMESLYELNCYHSDGIHKEGFSGREDFILSNLAELISKLPADNTMTVRGLGSSERKWTFDDIQIGWLFKAATNYIYIKISERKCRCIQNGGNEFYVSDLICDFEALDCNIANAYDCPELAKALMIERIVT